MKKSDFFFFSLIYYCVLTFLDSGIGGLTTLKIFRRLYPNTDVTFIADTLFAPYGALPRELLTERVSALCALAVQSGSDAVLFACNTASTATTDAKLCLPAFRVLPPLADALSSVRGKVLLLCTEYTARSDYVACFDSPRLTVKAAPTLATAIENAAPDFADLELLVLELLAPYDFDALCLGCTHYAYLEKLIKKHCPEVRLFDGSRNAVEAAAPFAHNENGITKFVVTGKSRVDYEKFFAEMLRD